MKFIDLNKQYQLIKGPVNKDILSTLEKGDFILGDKVFELESKLAEYVGVKECITCASGTDALLIPLMAEKFREGDAIFTTNFSYFATTEVISLIGATPVFVDINKKTFNIDPDLLENTIINTLNDGKLIPRAIIAVDIFGQLANYSKIEIIAKKYNLLLIEDAAQSFGATYNNKKSCSFGDVAATSFYPAKPLGCYGDGGAIFTNNSNKADIYRSIRVHGQGKDKYDNIRIGINSRLDTLQAVILLNKLKIFDKELTMRNEIANIYLNKLSNYLRLPFIDTNNISSWAQFSVIIENGSRDDLIDYLTNANIPTAIFYKKIFSELEMYKHQNISKYFNVSSEISGSIFSIPMHPYLDFNNQRIIIDAIIKYFNK